MKHYNLVYLLLLAACLGLAFCNPPEKDDTPWKVDCSRYTPVTDTVNGIYLIDTVMSDGKLQTDFMRNVTFAGNDTFEIVNRYLTDCNYYVRDFRIENDYFPYPRSNAISFSMDPYNYDTYINWQGGPLLNNKLKINNGNDTIFLFKNCSCGENYQYYYANIKILRKGVYGSFKITIYMNQNNYITFSQI